MAVAGSRQRLSRQVSGGAGITIARVHKPRRKPGDHMDLLQRINETRLPFAELLGIEFVSAAPEKIVAEMAVREDLCTNPAVLHGGAIMAFADTLGAVGTIANLPQGAGTT